jgi:predicted amidohydrolase
MPNAATKPLFKIATELGVGFCLGYAEISFEGNVKHRYNTSILVDRAGKIAGKYRKVHVPGHREHEPERPFQHLEKRYFETGNLGFPVYQVDDVAVGMFICNDRRWPETWRVMGIRGAQLICGGFNTPTHSPPVPQHDHLTSFHHLLSMQAGAYQNGVWAAAAAKAGMEEGSMLLGYSCIVAPTGEIVALSSTVGDEVITAVCDLDRSSELRDHIFNFKMHRQPQHYGLIAQM